MNMRRNITEASNMNMRKRMRNISDDDIRHYVVKKAVKFAKKVNKSESEFVWEKKIEHDLGRGVGLDDLFSVEAVKKRQADAKIELEKARERREKRRIKIHEATPRRGCSDRDRDHEQQITRDHEQICGSHKISSSSSSSSVEKQSSSTAAAAAGVGVLEEGELVVFGKKPKCLNRVRTGYEWNKYNRIHYDGDKPPPKGVQGYKFDLLYADLPDKSTPCYSIEKDVDSTSETCILRFHAGEPYQDVAFRIVNREWDYSPKNGFKCTFQSGILRLYFNLKRLRYRR